MIIREALIGFAFFCCIPLFSQNRVAKDADGNLWMQTDTISGKMYYIDKKGLSTEVVPDKQLASKIKILDSLVLQNQYELWSKARGYLEFEPYASAVYSIFFSKKMKILEVRILRREAYERNPIIDNKIIKAIKKTKGIWKKKDNLCNSKNIIFVGRTRVVMPFSVW